MMNTDFEKSLVSTLPDHLIFDNILPRLRVKTLLRFKTVCKLWYLTISSSEFAKSHLKFSSLFPHFVVLTLDKYDPDKYDLLLLHYDENNDVTDFDRVYMDSDWVFPSTYFMASCNGLLCFHLQGDFDYFCVWNPLTRHYRNILIPLEGLVVCFGFSYASSIDDYKIVAEISYDGDNRGVFYYSLRSDQWKRIDGRNERGGINNTRFYPLKDWQLWKEDKCIVGFDIVDEKLTEIPYMNWLSQYVCVCFSDIKECVALLCSGYHFADVWVLKQFGDWNSWEKLCSVNIEGLHRGIHIGSITETGKCLHQNLDELKVVDFSEGAPDESRVGVDIRLEMCDSGVYVESLISPCVFPILEG